MGARSDMRTVYTFSKISAVLLIALLPTPSSSDGISWEAAIARVEEQSAIYFEYARSRENFGAATALSGKDFDRHICAILGRMLGFVDEIREAENLEAPPLAIDVDAVAILEHAYSLDSWVVAARQALAMEKMQRETTWNLSCVGSFGIPSTSFIAGGATPNDLVVSGDTLTVLGDIDAGFHARFVSILDRNPQVTEIRLGSGGGSIRDAILSGREVRQRGLQTTISSACYSACPYLFAGGVERWIWPSQGDLEAPLGFHQISDAAGPISSDDPVYLVVRNYFDEMGVSSVNVLEWMLAAPPNQMHAPSGQEICASGLATRIYHVC